MTKEESASNDIIGMLKKIEHDLAAYRKITETAHDHLEKSVREIIKEDLRVLRTELLKMIPDNHKQKHRDLTEFMSHSPTPKEHGEDHQFVKSTQQRYTDFISALIKGLGAIIALSLLLGLGSYMIKVVGDYKPSNHISQQNTNKDNNDYTN